jgi:queuine tRNA-ribosyltransferase
VLDDLVPAGVDEAKARETARRTLLWATRAKRAIEREDQLTFAIVQGSTYEHLRRQQSQDLAALDFPGYAIGGLWVGEERALGFEMVSVADQELPQDKPRYLMGVGTPEDIIDAIDRGVDLFDCVYPTRCGRHALALTSTGRLNLRNASFSNDLRPLDEACGCGTCTTFTRAYIAHCFRAGELLAARVTSIHNIAFLTTLVAQARAAIAGGNFAAWRRERHASLREMAVPT